MSQNSKPCPDPHSAGEGGDLSRKRVMSSPSMIRKGQLRDINELQRQKQLYGPMRQEETPHVNQNCKLMSKKNKDITIKINALDIHVNILI